MMQIKGTDPGFKSEQGKGQGRTAIVLGGSMAGIWTARVLAEHFERVTVVERDELPATPGQRPGVPQGRQYHIMLRRGLQIMEQLFPGVEKELLSAGAARFDQLEDVKTKFQGTWLRQYPSGEMLLGSSRVLLETTLRRRLGQHPRVEILDGAEVTRLLADSQGRGVAGVDVRWRRGPRRGKETALGADLVVDATGRNSRAPQWLADLGYPLPEETVINSYLGYVTRRYRRRQRGESPGGSEATSPGDAQGASPGDAEGASPWKMLYILPNAPHEPRSGLIFPEENDTWVVMMAGVNKDYPPTDEAGFEAFARSLDPDFYAAVKAAEPISPAYGYRRTENRWRHYEALSPWPEGFVVVGDAFAAFNPIYGQGMTVSAMAAEALDEMLRGNGQELQGLAAKFQKKVAEVTKPVWLLTTSADLAWPGTEGGGEKSLADRFAYWYTDRVMDAVPHDDTVRRAFLDVNHLMRPATSLLSPGIAWRVLRHALRRRLRPAGDPREEPRTADAAI